MTRDLDLSRICAAPIAHLSDLSFEGQGAFPAFVQTKVSGDLSQLSSLIGTFGRTIEVHISDVQVIFRFTSFVSLPHSIADF